MAAGPIPGWVTGIVTENEDPEVSGRIKVKIPGLYEETPFWVYPAGWPGGGHPSFGSQYRAPCVNAQVFVMFEWGVWDNPSKTRAIYLTGYYGLESGISAGPEAVFGAGSAAAARDRTVLWEDRHFQIYITEDVDTPENRVVIQTKVSGSRIELNASHGDSGVSETITLEARTGMSLFTRGVLNIDATCGIFINGRKVANGNSDI